MAAEEELEREEEIEETEEDSKMESPGGDTPSPDDLRVTVPVLEWIASRSETINRRLRDNNVPCINRNHLSKLIEKVKKIEGKEFDEKLEHFLRGMALAELWPDFNKLLWNLSFSLYAYASKQEEELKRRREIVCKLKSIVLDKEERKKMNREFRAKRRLKDLEEESLKQLESIASEYKTFGKVPRKKLSKTLLYIMAAWAEGAVPRGAGK